MALSGAWIKMACLSAEDKTPVVGRRIEIVEKKLAGYRLEVMVAA